MLLSTAEWVLISTVIYYLVSFPASPGFSVWFVLTIIHGGYLMPTWAGKIATFQLNAPVIIRNVMTGAFSRNVGKLFFELKLVTDNASFMQQPNWEATEIKNAWVHGSRKPENKANQSSLTSTGPYTLACGGCGVHGKPENKANQSSLISSLHFSLWWVWCTTLILISCLLPRRAPEPPWMETPSTSLSAQVLLTLSAWLIKTQMCMEHTSPLS